MKRFIFSIAVLSLAAVSCNKINESYTTITREPMTIGISTSGIDVNYTPLSTSSRASSGTDLLAIQIYEGETPVAKGVVENWSNLSFEGYSNTTYTVVATMVVDATSVIAESGGIYALPFNYTITTNLISSSIALEGISSSSATLAADGEVYTIPNIDRYYGTETKVVTEEDATITTYLKRISFGVKVDGVSDTITIQIEDAPAVDIAAGDIEIFSFSNLTAAYTEDETTFPYNETMAVSIAKGGGEIYSGDVTFLRNMLATISIDPLSGDLGFDFEVGFEGLTYTLTFEDEDYLAGENYIGQYSWSSLIDTSENNGSLIYSYSNQYTWSDTDNTYLSGGVNEGLDRIAFEYNWFFSNGGIAISNYYCEVVAGAAVTSDNQLSVSNGSAGAAGNNGSANFAIVNDASAEEMCSPTYLSFSDETARTIDHLYISSTSYLESTVLESNIDLTINDYYTITATGYNADGVEIATTSYELVVEGTLTKGWNRWSLSSLGSVAKVGFSVASSLTLPKHFAIDDIAVIFE
ncbi:MAG: DUF4465 domain-containing protein [Rikenellaceae bacterium]